MQNTVNNNDRTYTVTEWCPHCENEIEMRWDTDTMGFKAFCPVCGKRLMLCDECRHAGCGDCDYNSATDSCRHNRPEKVVNDMEKYIVLVTSTQALSMIANLGNGPTTENGDRSSQYFAIAKGRNHIDKIVSASLVENINGLPEGKGYYTLHLVDDVNDTPCELYHTDDLSEDSLIELLGEILDSMEKGASKL